MTESILAAAAITAERTLPERMLVGQLVIARSDDPAPGEDGQAAVCLVFGIEGQPLVSLLAPLESFRRLVEAELGEDA